MSTSIRNAMKRDNDELYTPKILVDVIMPFVENYIDGIYSNWSSTKPIPRIWCPFDKENSEFVIALKEKFGKSVEIIHSHISEPNGDFFEKIKTIGHVDLVLSNPPFSRKLDIIKILNDYIVREPQKCAIIDKNTVFGYVELKKWGIKIDKDQEISWSNFFA